MPGTVVTIGNFDGVHRGHVTLIERARAHAGVPHAGGRVVALAFDPHPASVLRPGTEPARLTTFEQRAALLAEAGADEVRRLEPDRALLSMSPETFLAHVRDSFRPTWLVEGADFHFGKGRSGHVAELRAIGERLGYGVDVVEPVDAVLGDHSIVTASSSIARWLLAHGRVADAGAVLGRPYEVTGPVVAGDRRGRAIGFPTVNINAEQITPGPGVYACEAALPDGRTLPAAAHVGERPSVGDGEHRVEAHILGLPTSFDASEGAPSASDGPNHTDHTNAQAHPAHRSRSGLLSEWSPIDGLSETGWRCGLRFIRRLRDPIPFSSIDRLVDQLARDCARVGEVFESAGKEERV
ncbi:MAG: adenylyltransferase/cytidyltransferase family protein [Phycisphaeraceae bacterium]|nr:MAG: adenylyltransferase/cytidyltransferase family protein [Phycisphaeraceae bacterium]